LLAPAGTPKDVVTRLNEALHSALTNKDLVERFRNDGSEPMIMASAAFDEFLKQDLARKSKLVTDLAIAKQ
jgi:tripartite-type tricarboxylate transporter receptor subunit TctC